jgi:hypothetical protein
MVVPVVPVVQRFAGKGHVGIRVYQLCMLPSSLL